MWPGSSWYQIRWCLHRELRGVPLVAAPARRVHQGAEVRRQDEPAAGGHLGPLLLVRRRPPQRGARDRAPGKHRGARAPGAPGGRPGRHRLDPAPREGGVGQAGRAGRPDVRRRRRVGEGAAAGGLLRRAPFHTGLAVGDRRLKQLDAPTPSVVRVRSSTS